MWNSILVLTIFSMFLLIDFRSIKMNIPPNDENEECNEIDDAFAMNYLQALYDYYQNKIGIIVIPKEIKDKKFESESTPI
ncbi:hypothetical protein HZS_1082, partial [Henneguya salminicola]